MDVREEVARFISEYRDWDGARQYVKDGWLHKADQIIPIVRADTLKSISKESLRLDGSTYLVPDYNKFKEMLDTCEEGE